MARSLTCDEVKALIEVGIPDASAEVRDLTGTSDHFSVRVTARSFQGKSLLDQHRMVHSAVGEYLTREIHALEIKTLVPPA